MTTKDSEMPDELIVWEDQNKPYTYLGDARMHISGKEYIRKDSPNYHVIKKSDVDGDVMGALDDLSDYEDYETIGEYYQKKQALHLLNRHIQTILNALIAQSCSETGDKPDPDIVRIPRKVLEGMKKSARGFGTNIPNNFVLGSYNQAINDVLNYKEGE